MPVLPSVLTTGSKVNVCARIQSVIAPLALGFSRRREKCNEAVLDHDLITSIIMLYKAYSTLEGI